MRRAGDVDTVPEPLLEIVTLTVLGVPRLCGIRLRLGSVWSWEVCRLRLSWHCKALLLGWQPDRGVTGIYGDMREDLQLMAGVLELRMALGGVSFIDLCIW